MEAGVSEQQVSLRRLASECVDLARRAGGLIRAVSDQAAAASGATMDQLGLVDKGLRSGSSFDPQTTADRQAQRCIVENLRAMYGEALRIVGEEGDLGAGGEGDTLDGAVEIFEPNGRLLEPVWPAEKDTCVPLAELCVWVDPLDGTREFTEGRYQYVSTLVGITRAGRPVAGVISEPYAAVGGSSLLGRVLWGCCDTSHGHPCVGVHVLEDPMWARPTRPAGRCLAVLSRSRGGGAVADALVRLQEPGCTGGSGPLVTGTLQAGGAGHKVARVVDGTADLWLFPRPGTSRWDICAAEAMLKASGGALKDRAGSMIDYDPDAGFGNDAGVLAGAAPEIVERAAAVCATLDVARDAAGAPLSRRWLEAALGLPTGTVAGFVADAASCVRGKHSSVMRLQLQYAEGSAEAGDGHEARPASLILKRVVPRDLEPRGARKWLRDAASYRAEINFFRWCAGLLAERGVRMPRVYHVVSEGVEGLAPLSKAAEAEADTMERVLGCRFLVLAEDLQPRAFRQELELGGGDLVATLRLAARLHGATFEDAAVLERAASELFEEGCYWGPSMREPTELQGLPDAWRPLAAALAAEAPALFASPGVQSLGERLVAASRFADASLRTAQTEEPWRRRSLVHGDMKTANVFLDVASGEAVPIDFQWAGVNYGAQDVAYMMLSSAALADLAEGSQIEALLVGYHEELVSFAEPRCGAVNYPLEDFLRDFKLACLDYARIIFAYQLKGRDLGWVRAGAGVLGRCTHNRSLPHLLGLVRFLDALIAEWEVSGDLAGALGSMPGFGSPLQRTAGS